MARRRDPRALVRRPIVVAPMAGGPSTPALVVAAARAGALGFLAGGDKAPAAVAAEIAAVKEATEEPFGVNLFVPGAPCRDRAAVATYVASLRDDAAALGCTVGAPEWDDDDWDEKLETVLAAAPPVVSFTFGCPTAEVLAAFRAAGTLVAVTVTTADEAAEAAGRGAELLCAQGSEAGGHRGSFRNDAGPHGDLPVLALLDAIAKVTDRPRIAAGGIAGPEQVRAVLDAGALAAQCGTAFLRCPESGAHPAHKAALADPRFTVTTVTRAFSGRWARGIANRFVRDHGDAPAAYPEINRATRPLRAAAAEKGDTERMSLWAGTRFFLASDRPAGELVDLLDP